MAVQSEFFKNVREGVVAAQAKATARLGTLNDDARRRLEGLVEKGRVSQRDLTDRLQKLTQTPVFQDLRPAAEDYKAKVEKLGDEVTRKVKTLQDQAVRFAEGASRERVSALAVSLRKLADRIENTAARVESAAEAVEEEASQLDGGQAPAEAPASEA